MNIPTNKIRDLVATLQQLDQDAYHHFETAEVCETANPHRRYLYLFAVDSPLVSFPDFLDQLYSVLPSEACEIAEDIDTPNEFIRKLVTHLNSLHRDIKSLQSQIDQLQSTASTTA